MRGAFDRLGLSAAAFVEGNPVQIEFERLLVFDELGDVLFVEQDAWGVGDRFLLVDLRPGEDDRRSVRAPGRITLDIVGVVGARQRLVATRFRVVDHEDALDRKEELGKRNLGGRYEDRPVLDRADHVATTGGDLGQEPEGGLTIVLLIVAPGNDSLVVHHHLLRHGENRVAALVVAVVDVEA